MSAETNRLQSGETARAIQIPTGSVSLEAELIVPALVEGLVVFSHASAQRSLLNRRLAALLRRAGLGTLLLELLTPEESAVEGREMHSSFNMGLLTQRLVCAAHWVADEDEARNLRIGFMGSGTGAGAALVAAADLGKSIGAVVSRGGRPDLAGNALRRVKAPTLLIAGEHDESALEVNEDAYGMLAGEKSLSIVRGATHHFEEAGATEEVARLAADWFLEHLRPFSSARFARS